MDLAIGGWLCELKKYFRSVEELTEKVLMQIKQDRIQNHLPFDDEFKDFIQNGASTRISNAYTNFLYEERLNGGGQGLTNQIVNDQSDVSGHANIGRQLTLSRISPESVGQMPIILVQSNDQNLASNITANATFARHDNRLSDQIVITVPSNQLQSPESEVETQQNPARNFTVQFTDSIVKEEPRMEDAVTQNTSVESNSNQSNGNVNVVTNGMAMESATTAGVNGLKCEEPFKPMANFNELKPETIDLISDQEDEEKEHDADTLNIDQITSNIRQQKQCESKEIDEQEDSVDHGEIGKIVAQNVENISGRSKPTIGQRKRENGSRNASGQLKKKSKLASSVDTTKERHECDYCEYSTEKKCHLNEHIRTHTGERPFECAVCEKRFKRKNHLNVHMKTHRAEFAFQCSNCRRGFANEEPWKLHESCCKAKGYECHLCKRIFIGKQHLEDHMHKHTGAKFRCSKCPKQFNYGKDLTHHMKTHGKLFRFQCLNCRLGFSQKTPWKLHESRCKAKQYECYLCSKKFYHKKCDLLYHMRYEHTGEKPFGCSDCQKLFYTKSRLTYHTKRSH